MKSIQTILGVALMIALASCGGSKQEKKNTSLSGTIKIDGSSTVYPITEAIAEEFRTVAPDVHVTVGISGTGGGFKKFGRGEIDINDASRPIKDKEIKACEDGNIQYKALTIAYDGLAVVVNNQNDWVESFTIDELKKLWEPSAEGNVMMWSDIRPEWPNEKINLYGPDAASGTYDYFTEVICGESGSSRGDYTNSADDNVLVQGISTDKYALGFFGLAYYEENADKLKLVGVDNGKGVVFPSFESVSSNTYTPLSRPVFIYVSKKAAERPEVVEFVNFYLNNASAVAKDVGYVSLPAEDYTSALAEFKAFLQ
ncbi:MAG: PstS family phosphate ABC transporter substrate-binding protein [Marinilabiliaceae bacterium]|nr:PstS family phosphate ABC transporter substrate-binding protein [Marinilabiliaceae bacterium]